MTGLDQEKAQKDWNTDDFSMAKSKLKENSVWNVMLRWQTTKFADQISQHTKEQETQSGILKPKL